MSHSYYSEGSRMATQEDIHKRKYEMENGYHYQQSYIQGMYPGSTANQLETYQPPLTNAVYSGPHSYAISDSVPMTGLWRPGQPQTAPYSCGTFVPPPSNPQFQFAAGTAGVQPPDIYGLHAGGTAYAHQSLMSGPTAGSTALPQAQFMSWNTAAAGPNAFADTRDLSAWAFPSNSGGADQRHQSDVFYSQQQPPPQQQHQPPQQPSRDVFFPPVFGAPSAGYQPLQSTQPNGIPSGGDVLTGYGEPTDPYINGGNMANLTQQMGTFNLQEPQVTYSPESSAAIGNGTNGGSIVSSSHSMTSTGNVLIVGSNNNALTPDAAGLPSSFGQTIEPQTKTWAKVASQKPTPGFTAPVINKKPSGGGFALMSSTSIAPNVKPQNNRPVQVGTWEQQLTNSSLNKSKTSSSGSTPNQDSDNRDTDVHFQKRMKAINPKNFDINQKKARFFVIKSYSEDDVHRSIKYYIWCSTEHGNKRLDSCFRELNGAAPLYLFFSVNGSGHFCGMAEMISPVDYSKRAGVWSQDKWKGQFGVRWIYVKDVPNNYLRHIRLENNDDKPVTNTRDATEVPLDKGKQVLKVIHYYKHTTSILDDFLHYERREEQEKQ